MAPPLLLIALQGQAPSLPRPDFPPQPPQLPPQPPNLPPLPPDAATCSFPNKLLHAYEGSGEYWYCCDMTELSNVAVLGHFSPPPPSPPPSPPLSTNGRRLEHGADSHLPTPPPTSPPLPATPPPSSPASCEPVRLLDLLSEAETKAACWRVQQASSPPPAPPPVHASQPLSPPPPLPPPLSPLLPSIPQPLLTPSHLGPIPASKRPFPWSYLRIRVQPFIGNWTFELFPNDIDWPTKSSVEEGMEAPVLYTTAGWLTRSNRPNRSALFVRMSPDDYRPEVTAEESITQCMPRSWTDFHWPNSSGAHFVATKGALCCHEACTFK